MEIGITCSLVLDNKPPSSAIKGLVTGDDYSRLYLQQGKSARNAGYTCYLEKAAGHPIRRDSDSDSDSDSGCVFIAPN